MGRFKAVDFLVPSPPRASCLGAWEMGSRRGSDRAVLSGLHPIGTDGRIRYCAFVFRRKKAFPRQKLNSSSRGNSTGLGTCLGPIIKRKKSTPIANLPIRPTPHRQDRYCRSPCRERCRLDRPPWFGSRARTRKVTCRPTIGTSIGPSKLPVDKLPGAADHFDHGRPLLRDRSQEPTARRLARDRPMRPVVPRHDLAARRTVSVVSGGGSLVGVKIGRVAFGTIGRIGRFARPQTTSGPQSETHSPGGEFLQNRGYDSVA